MGFKIGIDVGGTFTDFALMDEDGETETHKVLTTPDDLSRAVLSGLGQLAAARGLELSRFLARVETIVHGTTVTTNAVLTGNVARTGLLATRGFRDALEMRRGIREVQYDNKYLAPPPLVPRYLRLPVRERVAEDGSVLAAIDLDEVDRALERLREAGVEALAICFLHAYANDDHERAAARRVGERWPELYLSVSSRVLPQVRYYDRVSTTVLNAAVGPILNRYLESLTARLSDQGFRGVLLIMQSNGGVTAPEVVMEFAVSTLLSGPAAAPVAGLAYADLHGDGDFITVDMGGTSFDAALVIGGAPEVTTQGRVGRYALGLPALEINTVGAGGGSIAWIDEGGLLRMGPQSAGANPGPACYGRGGELPTCSDANLVLGYLDPDYFAGGRIKLDAEAARRAIRDKVARPLGLSLTQAAHGMYQIMNVNMATGIREISIQKGHDPREFPLICAGGAGPVHAALIARELAMPRVLIPRESSVFCAVGMLRSDLKHDFVRSYHTTLSAGAIDEDRFLRLVAEMEAEADDVLGREGIASSRRVYRHAFDLRYQGQYHEVTVEVGAKAVRSVDLEAIARAFHSRHDRLYGYALEEEGTALELVNLRLSALGESAKPEIRRRPRLGPDASTARKGRRAVFLPSLMDYAEVEVYDGHAMGPGNRLEGPAMVERIDTTLFLPPDFVLEVDDHGSYLMSDREAPGGAAP